MPQQKVIVGKMACQDNLANQEGLEMMGFLALKEKRDCPDLEDPERGETKASEENQVCRAFQELRVSKEVMEWWACQD